MAGEKAYNAQTGQWAEWDGSTWRVLPPEMPQAVAGDEGQALVNSQPTEQRLPRAVNPQTGQTVVLRDGKWEAESATAELRNRSGQFLSGVTTGVSGLASLPGTLREGVAAAKDFVGDKAIDLWNRNVRGTGLEATPADPNARAQRRERVKQEVPTIIPGFEATERFVSNLPTKVGLEPLPTVRTVAEGKNPGVEKPNDFLGRGLQSTGEMFGGAPIAGGINLVGGLGGAALEQAFPDWKWSRPIGQIVSSGVYGLLNSMRSTPATVAHDATQHFGPDDWERAALLQQQAQEQGITLFAHEALANSASDPVAVMAGNARANPHGARVFEKALQERVPQMKDAAGKVIATVGDKVDDPMGVGIRAQKASEAALAAPKTERFNAAKPFYDRAGSQILPPQAVDDLVAKIDASIAGANPKGEIGSALRNIKDKIVAANGNVGQIDEIFKEYRKIIEAQAFPTDASVKAEILRPKVKPVIKDIRQTLAENSDDYARGVEIYKGRADLGPSMYTSAVNRADESALTPLSKTTPGTGTNTAFGNILLDGDKARPESVRFAVRALAKQDPEAAANAVRLHLENALDESFKRLQTGPNPASGANFANSIGGTAQQRANLFAALDALPSNGQAVGGRSAGFKKLLDVLDKTGMTPGTGSPTAGRTAMNAQMAGGGVVNAGLDTANVMQGSFIAKLQEWNRNISMGKGYRELAEAMTARDSVGKLQELAMLKPNSARAQMLVVEILTGARAAETAGPLTLP